MKAYGGVDVEIHIFLTSALAGGQLHGPAALSPCTHCIAGWVHPRAGLDDAEKGKFLTVLELELRPLGSAALSQSLYRLRYHGSHLTHYQQIDRLDRKHKTLLTSQQHSE
jgi:hypothetical protein